MSPQDMDAEDMLNYEEDVDEASGGSPFTESIKQEPILSDSPDIDVASKRREESPVQETTEVIRKDNASMRETNCEGESIKVMDDAEMFFMSMAKMTKTLPALEQAEIKLQLSNSVLQAQIRMNTNHYQGHPHCTCCVSRCSSTPNI